jgi:16S rRNA (guanine1207-N2)-methyltransferase
MNSNMDAWSVAANLADCDKNTIILCPDFSFEIVRLIKKLKNCKVYSPLKVVSDEFKKSEIEVTGVLPIDSCDQFIFVPTRQKVETLGLLAIGVSLLTDGGDFIFSCANDQGAKGYLSKISQVFGEVEAESKKKCRFIKLSKKDLISNETLKIWTEAFSVTQIEGENYKTHPGIYGWNKVDIGSDLLLKTLPKLNGVGADLGCGYGFLSKNILNEKIQKLYLLENDFRALECARMNLKGFNQCEFLWIDVTSNEAVTSVPQLDWVIMNPPFHEGRSERHDLGRLFIQAARKMLKKQGRLYLVANSFLAYEDILVEFFGSFEKIKTENGFKVLHV